MKKIMISIALILFSGNSVWANNYLLSYEAQQIENGNYPKLTVWKGSGLTLNFTALKDESVKSLWLDDPSKLVVDYAGQLCSVPCRGGVNVIHLKRVTGLNFANLPATARTTLTVVTVSRTGDKVYKFILGYGGGEPKYLAVNLTPPTKQRPLPPLFDGRQLPPPVKLAPTVKIDSERINLLKQGLAVARQKLKPTTRNQLLFNRFQLFISQLESGAEEEDARQHYFISANAVRLIADFGQEQKVLAIKEQENNTSVTKNEEPPNSRQMANDIVRGLIVAANKKQINYGTTTYRQVQSAIRALRREKTLVEAAHMAKLKLSLLEQLLTWGQQ